MIKKIILITFFSFLLSSCDYRPIYSTNNYDFSIKNVSFDGDIEINLPREYKQVSQESIFKNLIVSHFQNSFLQNQK